jgi:hypothetical protein
MTPTYSIAPVSQTSVHLEIMWYSRKLKIENVCNDNDFFAILRSSDPNSRKVHRGKSTVTYGADTSGSAGVET